MNKESLKVDIINQYSQYIELLQNKCDLLQSKNQKYIKCKKGCSDCCKVERTVLPVEFGFIINHINNISKENKEYIISNLNESDEKCTFLLNDECLIYQARPVICRTHGLMLAYLSDDEANWNLSCCERNFLNLENDLIFGNENLLNMEEINFELISLNNKYSSLQKIYSERIILNKNNILSSI